MKGAMLRIEDGRGLMVEVQHGSVWLTQEGDPADVYLGPGQRFRVERNGLTVAQALSPDTTFTVAA